MLTQLILFFILGLIAFCALFLAKNPKQFIMAMIIVMAGWQGGYWLPFFQYDLRFSHILTIILFLYLLISPSRLKKQDCFVIQPLIPISGIIVFGLIAASNAVLREVAYGVAATFILDYLIVVCIISTIEKPKDVIYIFNAILITLCFQIIIVLIQYRLPGFKIGIIDEVSSQMVYWRMRGTFVHANHLGMFLMFMLPFLFRYLVIVTIYKKRKLSLIIIIIFLLGCFALYTTQNRGSQIGFIFGLLVTFIIDLFRHKMRIRKVLLRTSIILLIFICIAMVHYGNRIYYQYFVQTSDVFSQFEGRTSLAQEAIPRIRESLPFGIGMHNYESNIYRGYTVHNLYLLIAAEIGVGVIFFVWIIIYLIFVSIKLMRVKHIFVFNIGSAYMAMLIGFLISSWVSPDWFWVEHVRINFWIVSGIAMGTERLWKRMRNEHKFSKSIPLNE